MDRVTATWFARTPPWRWWTGWLTDPTGSGDPDFLIVGDLNAYAMEDPVMVIEGGGYADLIKVFVGTGFADGAYSFNFFSPVRLSGSCIVQCGYDTRGQRCGTLAHQFG